MAKFLTTARAVAEVEDIIKKAKKALTLISPYVQIPETLFQGLKGADRRGVKIVLVYGKRALKPEERDRLQPLTNLSLYFLENLHAKCYFNEEHMVITSLNLFEASRENREMGVLISAILDTDLWRDAQDETKTIVDSATKEDLKSSGFNEAPRATTYEPTGQTNLFCIRCRQPILLDPDKPLCRTCYDVWKEYENPEYPEVYCLACGKNEETSMLKPLCRSCYNKVVTYRKSH